MSVFAMKGNDDERRPRVSVDRQQTAHLPIFLSLPRSHTPSVSVPALKFMPPWVTLMWEVITQPGPPKNSLQGYNQTLSVP